MDNKSYLEYVKTRIETGNDIEKQRESMKQTVNYCKENNISVEKLVMFLMAEKSAFVVNNMRMARKLKSMGVEVDSICNVEDSVETKELEEPVKNWIDHREKMKNGLKIAYKKHASVEKVKELYNEGMSLLEIADELDISESTVRRRLKGK